MNIAFNSLFVSHSIDFFKIKAAQALSSLQRKIGVIAIAILSSIALGFLAYYLALRCFSFKVKPIKIDKRPLEEQPQQTVPELPLKVKEDNDLVLIPQKIEIEKKDSKKSISYRLKKNLEYARAQQSQESIFPVFKVLLEIGIDFNFVRQETKEIDERSVGIACTQGPRETMEDEDFAGIILPQINGNPIKASVFGIYDGHGGANASAFVKENLPQYLTKALEKHNQNGLMDEGIWDALKECFIQLGADYSHDIDGTTATIVMILNDNIWVANVGDSRTILVLDDETIQLSEDGNPEIDRYKKKIEKLGGYIEEVNGVARVNGNLAVARAIGDKLVKGKEGQCCVSSNPKITCYPLSKAKNGYLVLACDGLYDVATTNNVGNAINTMKMKGMNTYEMARSLVYSAIENDSKDNVSALVVKL